MRKNELKQCEHIPVNWEGHTIDLSRMLLSYRLSAGYTQKEVEEGTGIDERRLWGYENMKIRPAMKTFFQLLDFYGVEINFHQRGIDKSKDS